MKKRDLVYRLVVTFEECEVVRDIAIIQPVGPNKKIYIEAIIEPHVIEIEEGLQRLFVDSMVKDIVRKAKEWK